MNSPEAKEHGNIASPWQRSFFSCCLPHPPPFFCVHIYFNTKKKKSVGRKIRFLDFSDMCDTNALFQKSRGRCHAGHISCIRMNKLNLICRSSFHVTHSHCVCVCVSACVSVCVCAMPGAPSHRSLLPVCRPSQCSLCPPDASPVFHHCH